MKKYGDYFYYEDFDVLIQLKSASVDEKIFIRSISTLFKVEYDWQPKIQMRDGKRIVRQLGCGGNGCAYMTNNNKVVKFTQDTYESIFAIHLSEVTEYWPSIFVDTHKIYLSKDFSLIWKDYALSLSKEVIKLFDVEELFIDFLEKLYQGDSDWREYIELLTSIKSERDVFDKLLSFSSEFYELHELVGLTGDDLCISNIGLSKDEDRFVIFDYGMFNLSPVPSVIIPYNQIIDLHLIKKEE